jgi:hypothetical protein
MRIVPQNVSGLLPPFARNTGTASSKNVSAANVTFQITAFPVQHSVNSAVSVCASILIPRREKLSFNSILILTFEKLGYSRLNNLCSEEVSHRMLITDRRASSQFSRPAVSCNRAKRCPVMVRKQDVRPAETLQDAVGAFLPFDAPASAQQRR